MSEALGSSLRLWIQEAPSQTWALGAHGFRTFVEKLGLGFRV